MHRGREFHFVSYEPQPANERRGTEAVPAMWCMMSGGTRLPVFPQLKGQDVEELDRELLRWVDAQIFKPAERAGAARGH